MEERKPTHAIVLDAGPLLRNEPSISSLLKISEELFTTPAVINEIKDKDARARLEITVLPFLTIRSPTLASIKLVAEFAGKTGDLAVLSRPDIHILALAYELECERNHGDWRLRRVPGQKGLNGLPPARDQCTAPITLKDTATTVSLSGPHSIGDQTVPDELSITTEILTSEGPQGNKDLPTKVEEQENGLPNTSNYISRQEDPTTPKEDPNEMARANEAPRDEASNKTNNAVAATPDVSEIASLRIEDSVAKVTSSLNSLEPPPNDKPISKSGQTRDVDETGSESETSDLDTEGWITPSNLKKQQAKDLSIAGIPESEPTTMQVATITNDFAMQNVLLRMNLNLLSPNSLLRIRQLKTYILRCHACFDTTRDLSKQFCKRCGGATLTRVACSTSANGGFKLHLKKNMQWNTRGDRFSIPKPVAGTANGKAAGLRGGGKGGWGRELILAEDQKEYVAAMTGQARRKERDLMDEDWLPGILTGERGKVGGRPKVGGGRNVNSKKR
jgi:RNA-binding protein NOB1